MSNKKRLENQRIKERENAYNINIINKYLEMGWTFKQIAASTPAHRMGLDSEEKVIFFCKMNSIDKPSK